MCHVHVMLSDSCFLRHFHFNSRTVGTTQFHFAVASSASCTVSLISFFGCAHCHLPPSSPVQVKYLANPSYLGTIQPNMDAHKRFVLVDWLVEVVDEFELQQETLFLAVNMLDRCVGSLCNRHKMG